MFPHEHFVVAFVPVLAYVLVRDRGLPTLPLVGVVFLGSQFPDLVDKPLGTHFGVVPTGRVFMHSLPPAALVLLVVVLYGWQTDRLRLGVAFGFAHLSHLLADNYGALLGPDPHVPSDLLWPFLPPIARPGPASWGGPGEIYVQLWTTFSIVVLALAVVVLYDSERARIGPYREFVVRRTYRLYRAYHPPQ